MNQPQQHQSTQEINSKPDLGQPSKPQGRKRAQTAKSAGKTQKQREMDAKIELIKVYSRMGKATESHFAVLNKKMQNQKSNATVFNPEKILNPALRANKNPVQHEDKKELAKIKQMFLDAHYKRNSMADRVPNFPKQEEEVPNAQSGEVPQPTS